MITPAPAPVIATEAPTLANGGTAGSFVLNNTSNTPSSNTPSSNAPSPANGGSSGTVLDTNGNVIKSSVNAATTNTGSTTNPTVTSAGTRATYDALGNNITSMFDTTNTQKIADQQSALIKNYQDKLDANYQGDVSGVKQAYAQEIQNQADKQAKQYAGTSTALITSGGGFLGSTGSHGGVLQNLNDTFVQQNNALLAQRDTAIQQARDAYDSKNFDLASQQLKIAQDTQATIYQHQKDQNEATLQYTSEQRTNNTYLQGIADKQASSIATMTPEEFAKVPQDQIEKIDKFYFPGYTKQLQETTQKAAAVKTATDAVDLESKIIDMRSKIPAGRSFTVNGQTYSGLKAAPAGSSADQKQTIVNQISSLFVPNANDGKAPTIPNSGGVPFVDTNGFATPQGWKAAIAVSGMNRPDFIKQFGYLLSPDSLSSYQLTPAEQKLVTAQAPVYVPPATQ